jgi:hypothetical protein
MSMETAAHAARRLAPVLALALCGCPAVVSDPPPPPTKAEIVSAPPRALGALAAGTDAAPRPDVTAGSLPGLPEVPEPGGGALPEAGPGPTTSPPPAAADAGVPL